METLIMNETQVRKQLQREARQLLDGGVRYDKRAAVSAEGEQGPGRGLVMRAVVPVADAVRELVSRTEAGKAGAGRPAVATSYLCQLDPEGIAFITGRVVLAAAARNELLTGTAMRLATQIEESYRFEETRGEAPKLSNAMERKARKWNTSFHRRAIMRKAAEIANVAGLDWKKGDRLHLGMKLIELFISETGLAEAYMSTEGKNNTPYRLRLTPATAEWLSQQHEHSRLLEPCYTPMVCPPKPWTSVISGGYLTEEHQRHLVRTQSQELKDDLMSTDLTEVMSAVNAIQATPWRINNSVLAVFDECWKAGDSIGGLPPADPLPVPERPAGISRELDRADMDEATLAEFNEWRHAASKAHDENAALIGKRLACASRRSMALDVADEEAIYFPQSLDFRGRIYSIVPDLNPQADDLGKSLLEFAEGKPLGESGAYWLAVHIANLFGVDKVSFDERVEWVMDHTAQILDSAASPLDGGRFWTEADDPWCALAACFEWAGYHAMRDDYVSHLPIAMDGSCSGLQHFSAMLRDAEGGAAVNLTQADSPADVYTEVAEKVEAALVGDTDLVAQAWAGNVTRKIVKRPCMTFAYSVTRTGMQAQILDELRKQSEGFDTYLPGIEDFDAARFLAPLVEDAIRATVNRAAEAMDYLKTSVGAVMDADRPITWYTPLGLPVQQRYVRSNGVRFTCWFGGSKLRLQLRSDTSKVDRRKQSSAVAPNYVHSLDACHLMMVANRMVAEGVTGSFAMIHDSFGVHACDVDELHYVIRDEFIKLYSVDQLSAFRQQMCAYLPLEDQDSIEPAPAPGTLDLEDVRAADFFFS